MHTKVIKVFDIQRDDVIKTKKVLHKFLFLQL